MIKGKESPLFAAMMGTGYLLGAGLTPPRYGPKYVDPVKKAIKATCPKCNGSLHMNQMANALTGRGIRR